MEKFYKRVFAKKVEWLGLSFDSKMEADFFKFMLENNITIQRNKYNFELIPELAYKDEFLEYKTKHKLGRYNETQFSAGRVYTPDFVITQKGLLAIVEIKGKQFIDRWNISKTENLFRQFIAKIEVLKDYKYFVLKSHDDFIPFLAYLQGFEGKIKDFKFNGKVRNEWN